MLEEHVDRCGFPEIEDRVGQENVPIGDHAI